MAVRIGDHITPLSQLDPITQSFIPNLNAIKSRAILNQLQYEHTASLVGVDPSSAVVKSTVSLKNIGSSAISAAIIVLLKPLNHEGTAPIRDIQYLSEKGFIVDHHIGVLFQQPPSNILCLRASDHPVEKAILNWEMILGCKCPQHAAIGVAEFKCHIEANDTFQIQYDCPAHPQSSLLPIVKKTAPPIYKSFIQNKITDYTFDITRFDQSDRLAQIASIVSSSSEFNRLYSLSCAHILESRSDLVLSVSHPHSAALTKVFSLCNALGDIGASETVRSILTRYFNQQSNSKTAHRAWTSFGPMCGILHNYAQSAQTLESFNSVFTYLKREAQRVSKQLAFELSENAFFKSKLGHPSLHPSAAPIADLCWAIYGLKTVGILAQDQYDFETAQKLGQEASHFQALLSRHIRTMFEKVGFSPWLPSHKTTTVSEHLCDMIPVVVDIALWAPTDPLIRELTQQLSTYFKYDKLLYMPEEAPGLSVSHSAQFARLLLALGERAQAFEIWNALISLASPTGTWPERMHPKTLMGCFGDGHDLFANAEFIRLTHALLVNVIDTGVEIVVPDFLAAEPGQHLCIHRYHSKWGSLSIDIKTHTDCFDVLLAPNPKDGMKDIFVNLPRPVGQPTSVNGVHRISGNRIRFMPNQIHIQLPIEVSVPVV